MKNLLAIRRPEVTRYLDSLSKFVAAQLAVSEDYRAVEGSRDARLQRLVRDFIQKSNGVKSQRRVATAISDFVKSGDFEAYFAARGQAEFLAKIDGHDSDVARRFAECIRATDRAGAEFMLAHRDFLAHRRGVALFSTAEGMGVLDAELATGVAEMGDVAMKTWMTVARFPVWQESETPAAS